jgi:hypothetical protein
LIYLGIKRQIGFNQSAENTLSCARWRDYHIVLGVSS